jgi:hypothetical protein
MKRTMAAVSSVLLSAVTVGATAVANESELTFRTPFDAICTTERIFAETLYSYGETPIMRGQSVRDINGAMVSMNTVLFMNLETGSWTLAEKIADDAFCVVAMGQNWQVYQRKNPGVQG